MPSWLLDQPVLDDWSLLAVVALHGTLAAHYWMEQTVFQTRNNHAHLILITPNKQMEKSHKIQEQTRAIWSLIDNSSGPELKQQKTMSLFTWPQCTQSKLTRWRKEIQDTRWNLGEAELPCWPQLEEPLVNQRVWTCTQLCHWAAGQVWRCWSWASLSSTTPPQPPPPAGEGSTGGGIHSSLIRLLQIICTFGTKGPKPSCVMGCDGITRSYLSVTGWQRPLEYGPDNRLVAFGGGHGPSIAVVSQQLMGRREDAAQFEVCYWACVSCNHHWGWNDYLHINFSFS